MAASNTEEWRPIVGYEGRYEVSSQGRVRSLIGRNIRVLKPHVLKAGYETVELWRKNQRKRVLVHRLVAQAFLSHCLQGLEVNHKDGVKRNNHVANLEYLTRSDNAKHALEKGLYVPAKGEQRSSLLTDSTVFELRELAAKGLSYVDLGKRYGISAFHAGDIARGARWAHVGGTRTKRGASQGKENGKSKLTEVLVLEIRKRAAQGESVASIARSLPFAYTTISAVVLGISWKHITLGVSA